MEALRNDPIAGKYMQKWVWWGKENVCTCHELNYEQECYRDNEFVYVLQTPEERPVFGVATAVVHSKCKKPVHPDHERAIGKEKVFIPSKWEFYER